MSLFGQTSLAVSDSVFRRKLYFTQLDKGQREKERERDGETDRERKRDRDRERKRETETERQRQRELIKDGCKKRSEIFKYFHFCAKYFSMKVVVATSCSIYAITDSLISRRSCNIMPVLQICFP